MDFIFTFFYFFVVHLVQVVSFESNLQVQVADVCRGVVNDM